MADWTETLKGSILASEYDSEAHMNSSIYVSRFDQATWFLLHTVGITPAAMKAGGRRVAIIRQNYQYLRELRGGELVTVRSGFLAVGHKHLRFLHQMYDHVGGALVATSDCTAVLADLGTGRSVPLPGAQQKAAEARLVVANAASGEAPPPSGPRIVGD